MLKLDCMINTASKGIILYSCETKQLLLRRHVNMADENRTFPTEINSQEFHLFSKF